VDEHRESQTVFLSGTQYVTNCGHHFAHDYVMRDPFVWLPVEIAFDHLWQLTVANPVSSLAAVHL